MIVAKNINPSRATLRIHFLRDSVVRRLIHVGSPERRPAVNNNSFGPAHPSFVVNIINRSRISLQAASTAGASR